MSSQTTHTYPKVVCCIGEEDQAVVDITEQLEIEEEMARYLVRELTRRVKKTLRGDTKLPQMLSGYKSTATRRNGTGPETVTLKIRVSGTNIQTKIPVDTPFLAGLFGNRADVVSHLADGLGVPRYVASSLVKRLQNTAPCGAPFYAYTETVNGNQPMKRVHLHVEHFHEEFDYDDVVER